MDGGRHNFAAGLNPSNVPFGPPLPLHGPGMTDPSSVDFNPLDDLGGVCFSGSNTAF